MRVRVCAAAQNSIDFVRSGALKDFRLQANVEAGALAEESRRQHRRMVGVRGDAAAGLFKCIDPNHMGQRSTSSGAGLEPAAEL